MFEEISQALVAIREGFALFREVHPAERSSAEEQRRADQLSKQLEAQINQAHQALRHEELRLAMLFGYQTCQCTFPPEIVLKEPHGQRYLCQRCGAEYPNHRAFGASVTRS